MSQDTQAHWVPGVEYQYAIEFDPGRLYPTFPIYDTEEECRRAASYLVDRWPSGIPPLRLLYRVRTQAGGGWSLLGNAK